MHYIPPVRAVTTVDRRSVRLLALLAHGPRFPDELLRACALSPREVGGAIATLSLNGMVTIDPSGIVRRNDASLGLVHA